MIATLLGGHTAEELIFNEMTTGGQDDIERATKLARKMVTDYGMSDKLGPRTFGDKQELIFLGREISEQKDYGDKIADVIDEEVDRIIGNAQNLARKILLENKPKLIELAQKLLAEETLEGDSLDALFGTTKTKPPEVTQTLAPAPIEATAEPAKQERKVTKPSIIPLPNQAPAPSDG